MLIPLYGAVKVEGRANAGPRERRALPRLSSEGEALLKEELCPNAVLHPEPGNHQPIMDLRIPHVKSTSN